LIGGTPRAAAGARGHKGEGMTIGERNEHRVKQVPVAVRHCLHLPLLAHPLHRVKIELKTLHRHPGKAIQTFVESLLTALC